MAGPDIVLLITGILSAVFSLCLLIRVRYRGLNPLSFTHFFFSLIGTQIPLQIATLTLICLVACIMAGSPLSSVGWVGAILAIAGISGLLLFLFRQFHSRNALKDALNEMPGVNPDGQTSVPQALWRAVRPLHQPRDQVERLRNLSYTDGVRSLVDTYGLSETLSQNSGLATLLQMYNVENVHRKSFGHKGWRNFMDIYRSTPLTEHHKLRPVLLQIHGSGWVHGNKNFQALPLIYHMAIHGWLVVSINYRLSPRARFPAHLVDVKRAIAWLRQNIETYGGDPDFIAVTGGSAGGHLATLAALTCDRPDLQPGFESVDTSVNAVVPVYGRYDFLDRDHPNGLSEGSVKGMSRVIMPGTPEEMPAVWELASPVSQVRPDAPPFLVIHGEFDTLIEVENVRAFVRKLRAISRNVVGFAELPGIQHGFDMVNSPVTEYTIHAIRCFLERQHAQFLSSSNRTHR